jgi:hypothetical protein
MLEYTVSAGRNTVNMNVKFSTVTFAEHLTANSEKNLSRTNIRLKNLSLQKPRIIKNAINIGTTKINYLVFIFKFLRFVLSNGKGT